MDILSKLNEYQRQAVLDESKACLVNANVGSGKTTVLISKVLFLHKEKGIPLSDMVVFTFTNKAANEIKERMVAFDKTIKDENMPYFGTFHSVALKMLQTFLPIDTLNYRKNFTIIAPDEELEMAESLIEENSLNIKYKNKLKKRLEDAVSGQVL